MGRPALQVTLTGLGMEADLANQLSTSLLVWTWLVYRRWASHVRNPAVGAALLVVTGALAVGSYFTHWAWGSGATAAVGIATLAWAAISVPIAAHEVWREERVARMAAEGKLESQRPPTLRLGVFALAREMRDWLKTIPEDPSQEAQDALVLTGYRELFQARVADVCERLRIARFPNSPLPLALYPTRSKSEIDMLAGDLEIDANRIAGDFLA
jgi:hypothetical protein